MPAHDIFKLSIDECAKQLKRSTKEVEDALVKNGLVKRLTRGLEIDKGQLLKLEAYFKSQSAKAASNSANRKGAKTTATDVEVVTKPKRGKLDFSKMLKERINKTAGAEPAKPAEMKAAAPAKTTEAKKTVQTAPAADAKATAAAPAEKSAAAAKPAKKTAAKPAKKEAAKKTATKKSAAKKPAKAAKKPAKKEATKKTAATKSAKKAAATDEATPTPTPAAETTSGKSNVSNIEKLLSQQIKHREQRAEKEKQIETAVQEKKTKEEARKKSKDDGTIKLGKEALEKHKKKNVKSISRSEALEKISENQQSFTKPTAPVIREIKIPDVISVSKLASEVALKSSVIIRKLMDQGMTVTTNELLNKEIAWIIVEELGHKPVDAPEDNSELELLKRDTAGKDIQPRAPVVTVMGHVDHGKTSLLDYIRKSRVAQGEAGGITQHIGAYRVHTDIGDITFLDTPGHALFSQMRARGSKITDIIVLVIAADDGIKPQTIEAINHAKAADVPMIVAASKADKPEANIDTIKRELANQDVLPEDWGGDTMVIPISSKTGAGIDTLLEALAMRTELLELSAPLDVPAVGVIIEARVDRGRGIVATLVVTRGVLKRGDAFLCGTESGRVRSMWDLTQPKLDKAYPSMPVEIQGLSGVPDAGAELLVVEDERTARDISQIRQNKSRISKMASRRQQLTTPGSQAALLDAAAAAEEWKELNVIIKADVEGSREAMAAALSDIVGKHSGVKVIHSAVGTVTESDIYLAQTSGGVIVAFNIRPDSRARKLAESRGVKIIVGNIVYELVEKIREAVLGLLKPIVEETVIGVAAVQKIFNINKSDTIAGCLVEEGVIPAKAPVKLTRDGAMVYEGAIASLYHFKDQVAEVRAGSECGIGIGRYNDIKAGDKIEALERTETAPEM